MRPVVQALATLAWEGRRGAFFTNELMDALRIVDRGDIDLDLMKGSWAGAMGQTQFMPSSYLQHAEDFDGDGHRDIWRSTPDVLASIANYLKARGWKPDETWGREVRLPAGKADEIMEKAGLRTSGCRAEREMTVRQPLKAWQAAGVRAVDGKALPRADRDASLFRAGKKAVPRVRELRGTARLQLCPCVRAGGEPVGRSDPPLVQFAGWRSPASPAWPR